MLRVKGTQTQSRKMLVALTQAAGAGGRPEPFWASVPSLVN